MRINRFICIVEESISMENSGFSSFVPDPCYPYISKKSNTCISREFLSSPYAEGSRLKTRRPSKKRTFFLVENFPSLTGTNQSDITE